MEKIIGTVPGKCRKKREKARLTLNNNPEISWHMKKSRRTYNGVHLNKKSNTQDVVEQSLTQNLIPVEVTPAQAGVIYAEEADVLNVAMFGMTARMWREQNPGLKGNIRDYASINELICLSNMENLNAVFIDQGIPQGERLVRLNRIAIQQMRVLEDDGGRKLLE